MTIRASTIRAAAVLLLAGTALAEGGPPPQPVRVEEVRSEKLQEHRRVTGTIRPVRRSLVAAREAGIVLELLVREGAAVKQGEVLARLDAERLRLDETVLQAEAAEARASIEERRAEEGKARREAATATLLAERGVSQPKERDDAVSDVSAAAARTLAAEKKVEVLDARSGLLRRRIADAEIRAPFPGTVTGLRAEVGSWVATGGPLLELTSTADLEARLDVPQGSLAPLRAHSGTVRLVLDASGRELDLDGARIVGEVDPVSRTFAALVPIPAAADVAPGMSVTATVPTGAEAEHLTVSRDALLRSATGPYLFVAVGGGEGKPATAAMVAVEILFSVGDRAAVKGRDLAAGAKAVVEGNERLFPGAPILPTTTPVAEPAGGPR